MVGQGKRTRRNAHLWIMGFAAFSPQAKIIVLPPSRPAASNSPPDCCILLFESHSVHKNKGYPKGYPLFLWQRYHKLIQCTASQCNGQYKGLLTGLCKCVFHLPTGYGLPRPLQWESGLSAHCSRPNGSSYPPA